MEVRARYFAVIQEGRASMSLDPQRDRTRIMPRIVTDEFLQRLPSPLGGQPVPNTGLGVAGLSIVLVLDSPSSVVYLTQGLLDELGLTYEEGLVKGKENLLKTFDSAIVRGMIDKGDLTVVKAGDSFDAARLLLVGDCLKADEQIAALIPDRDTLALVRPPADGDWTDLHKLARVAAADPLWREPLIVTRNGISSVGGQ
jgi:hypothetical protein